MECLCLLSTYIAKFLAFGYDINSLLIILIIWFFYKFYRISNLHSLQVNTFHIPCPEAEGVEGFDLKVDDLVYMATGNNNELIKALRRLINLLPIVPIYVAEEVRRVYENTREALEAM